MFSTYFSFGLADSDGVPLPPDDISLVLFVAQLGLLGHEIVAQTEGEGIWNGDREPCAILIVSSARRLDNDPDVLAAVRGFLESTGQTCAAVFSTPTRFVYTDAAEPGQPGKPRFQTHARLDVPGAFWAVDTFGELERVPCHNLGTARAEIRRMAREAEWENDPSQGENIEEPWATDDDLDPSGSIWIVIDEPRATDDD